MYYLKLLRIGSDLMSYDVYLRNNTGEPVIVSSHQEGGTFVLGEDDHAHLNITYNYSNFFYKELDKKKGLRWLYGKKGKNCIKRLEKAIKNLGTVRYPNYWKSTPGNAGYALSILLKWAKDNPEAVFDGD